MTRHIVTTRMNSSTEKALRYTLRLCEDMGAKSVIFGAAQVSALPHFAPELSERAEEARRLIEEISRADGLIVSPGYHGNMSGMVKNALDYTEDLREDPRAYLTGIPVGLIATGAGWQAIVTTLQGSARWCTRCAGGRPRSGSLSTRRRGCLTRRASARRAGQGGTHDIGEGGWPSPPGG